MHRAPSRPARPRRRAAGRCSGRETHPAWCVVILKRRVATQEALDVTEGPGARARATSVPLGAVVSRSYAATVRSPHLCDGEAPSGAMERGEVMRKLVVILGVL